MVSAAPGSMGVWLNARPRTGSLGGFWPSRSLTSAKIVQGERNQVYLNCRAAAYLLQSYVKKLINLLSLLYSLFLLRHFLNYLRDIFSFLRDIFPYMRRNFFLLAQKVFVTNFLIYVTNFVTHITNFVIRVTNFVINFFSYDRKH